MIGLTNSLANQINPTIEITENAEKNSNFRKKVLTGKSNCNFRSIKNTRNDMLKTSATS